MSIQYLRPLILEKFRWWLIRFLGGIVCTPYENYPYKENKKNGKLE